MKLKGVIFDLDGVIVDTVPLYYQANQMIADELGIPFNEELNNRLRGVSRKDVIDQLVSLTEDPKRFTEEQKRELAERKNHYYQRLLKEMDEHFLLPGIKGLLDELKQEQIKMAIASSSTNAQRVAEQLGINSYFDYIVDATQIRHGKPAPDIFLDALRGIRLYAGECIGIEDSVAGVKALNQIGLFTVGVGKVIRSQMHRESLHIDWFVETTDELSFSALKEKFNLTINKNWE